MVVTIGLGLWGLSKTDGFKQCSSYYKHHHAGQHPNEQQPSGPVARISRFEVNYTCIGSAINTYKDVINALSTLTVAIFTFSLWLSTHLMWKAANFQAQIAERDFVAQHRPWVSVEIRPASNLRIEPDGRVLLFPILLLENHGNSPALRIRLEVITTRGGSIDGPKIQKRMVRYGIRNFSELERQAGFVLFPRSKMTRDGGGSASLAKASDATGDYPLLVGYLTYEFGQDGTGKTWFCYMIAKATGGRTILGGIGMGIEAKDREIAREEVILHPTSLGNYAE